ncbi:Replication protein A 14 kDa subunit, partial [Galemys pyrenaicus]
GDWKDASCWKKMSNLSSEERKYRTMEFMEPLDEDISGIMEVTGKVMSKAAIICASYVQFSEDKHPLDLEFYSEWKLPMNSFSFFSLAVVQMVGVHKWVQLSWDMGLNGRRHEDARTDRPTNRTESTNGQQQ